MMIIDVFIFQKAPTYTDNINGQSKIKNLHLVYPILVFILPKSVVNVIRLLQITISLPVLKQPKH